jgi:cell filamentation protein
MHAPKNRFRKVLWISSITCAIHHHLFRDVYDWAVQPRTVRIARGGNPFRFPENIQNQATSLFEELRQADYLRGLQTQEFSHKAAHFLAELKAIHVFREGNGRSQLSFFALLAHNAGHTLNLNRLDPEEMLAAIIASFDGDEEKLVAVVRELIR